MNNDLSIAVAALMAIARKHDPDQARVIEALLRRLEADAKKAQVPPCASA